MHNSNTELIIKRFEELTSDELYELIKIRINVFVVEQKCPYHELDGKDKRAYHIYLKVNNDIKAYLRVIDAGVSYDEVSIGRVLTTERGKGYGDLIFREGIRVAKNKLGARKIKIGAQMYVKGFYERFGFRQISEEYLEDNIYHVHMILEL